MGPIMTQFTAQLRYEPSEEIWYANLSEESRVHTFGRSMRSALDHLRDAASLWFELDQADIELVPTPIVPAGHRKALATARRARRDLEQAEAVAGVATRTAAVNLTNLGLSRRDVADLLGISHQRVQQLLAHEVSDPERAAS